MVTPQLLLRLDASFRSCLPLEQNYSEATNHWCCLYPLSVCFYSLRPYSCCIVQRDCTASDSCGISTNQSWGCRRNPDRLYYCWRGLFIKGFIKSGHAFVSFGAAQASTKIAARNCSVEKKVWPLHLALYHRRTTPENPAWHLLKPDYFHICPSSDHRLHYSDHWLRQKLATRWDSTREEDVCLGIASCGQLVRECSRSFWVPSNWIAWMNL